MEKIRFARKSKKLVFGALLLGVCISYLVPLIKIWNTTIIQDWGYFNGLSHVVRSCIIYYKTIPIHNPWVLGGLDIFANPQSRIFSPFVIFDVLFIAPVANLFALVVLGIVGSFGFYRLLVYLKINDTIAVIGSIIFINASWFSLHYSEGHIVFGSFQLLGLAFYFILRIQEKKYKVCYAILNAFYLLDGAFYAFIFTNLLFISSILLQVNALTINGVWHSINKQWKTVIFSIFLFVLLVSAKMIPFLWLHQSRIPILEFNTIDFKTLLHCFFNPFQHLSFRPESFILKGIRFHELGAYIGILGVGLIAYFLIKSRKLKGVYKYGVIALLFLWIGSGQMVSLNPWHLFQKLPVLNNAHVQSRLFILTYLMYIILLCHALNFIKGKAQKFIYYSVLILLLGESIFVSTYPFLKVYTQQPRIYSSHVFKEPIRSRTINETIKRDSPVWGRGFLHYFNENTGAKYGNEPALVRGDIKSNDESDYKGEIYLIEGRGNVSLLSYTPGEIRLKFNLDTTSIIQLNTNYLLGWKSTSDGKIFSKDGLLTIEPSIYSGEMVLRYRPKYLYIILPLYALGILSIIIFYISIWRRKKRTSTTTKFH